MLGIFVALLTLCTLSHGFPGFLHHEGGSTYTFHSQIRVGSNDLEKESVKEINNYLHLKYHDDFTTVVKFSEHKVGVIKDVFDTLYAPFGIVYETDGKIKHILRQDDEALYSINAKKALASALQISIKCVEIQNPYKFSTEENSIYGNIKMHYDVTPSENEIIVRKSFNRSSSEWLKYFKANTEFQVNDFANLISINNTYTYLLTKLDGKFYVKTIKIQGGIYINTNRTTVPSQYMIIKQNIKLLRRNVINFSDQVPIKEEKLIISYERSPDSETFVSFKRKPGSTGDMVIRVDAILDKIVKQHNKNHLTTKIDVDDFHDINRLQQSMGHLNVLILEDVYNKLKESPKDKKKLKCFLEMVSLVGTKSSLIFVKNLIQEKKVDDYTAINMLKHISRHVRKPSEELLVEMEGLLTIDRVESVKISAVFTFATLVYRTYENRESLSNTLLEKYIKLFIEKITSTNDVKTQYMYINALYNIKINVTKYLLPIIHGNFPNVNRHIQYLAICACYSDPRRVPTDHTLTFEPIMENKTLHLELRIGAYMIMLNNILQSESLEPLFEYMTKKETSEEFYHYFYTQMKSIFQNDKRYSGILKPLRKPYGDRLSGYHTIHYKDPHSGFSAEVNAMIISTETSIAIYLDFSSQLLNVPIGFNGLWFKIDFNKPISKSEFSILNGINLNQLLLDINDLARTNLGHIEIAVLNDDQTIYAQYLDKGKTMNIDNLLHYISHLKETNDITYKSISHIVIPNSLGCPTMLLFKVPTVQTSNSNASVQYELETRTRIINRHFEMSHSRQLIYLLSTYNFFIDDYQSVRYINSLEYMFRWNISIATTIKGEDETGPKLYKLTFHSDPIKNPLEVRNYIISYLEPEDGDRLTKNQLDPRTYNMEVDPITGLVYELTVLNSKKGDVRQFLKNISTQEEGCLSKLMNIWQRLTFSTGTGTGFLYTVSPAVLLGIDHTDLTSELNLKMYDKSIIVSPTIERLNWKLSFSHEDEHHLKLKSWNFNINMTLNPERTDYKLNVLMKKTVLNEEFTYCIDGERKFLNDHISGRFAVKSGMNGVCTANNVLMYVKMKGQRSKEQVDEMTKLANGAYPDDCKYLYNAKLPAIPKLDCLTNLTSYRKYHYDFKITEDAAKKLKDFFARRFILREISESVCYSKPSCFKDIHNIVRVDSEFPMYSNLVKISFKDNNNSVCPVMTTTKPGWSLMGLYPDNYHFYQYMLYFNSMMPSESTIVHESFLKNAIKKGLSGGVPVKINKTLDFSNSVFGNHGQLSVSVIAKEEAVDKGNIKKMVLDIRRNDDTLQINNEKIIVNGVSLALTNMEYRSGIWYSVGKLANNFIIVYIPEWDVYIDFNGEYARAFCGPTCDI